MIVELDLEEYQQARFLFQELEKYILGITSVFEGNSNGMVVVNKKKKPTSGLMFLGISSIFLAGDSNNSSFNQSLKIFFQKTLIPLIKEKSENNSFSIYCNQKWKEKLNPIFGELQPIRRKFYQFKSHRFKEWREKIPDGYSIIFIDKNLLSNQKLKNNKSMLSWIRGCWITEDNYLSKGFGYSIIFNDLEIASVCLTNYFSENLNRCEIGIYTQQKFQKQGLAKILTSEIVKYCLNRKIDLIDWHTREENIASVKIAEAAGFDLMKEFDVYLGFI